MNTPKITPDVNPIRVSVKVTPRCFRSPFDDKFRKVSKILDG